MLWAMYASLLVLLFLLSSTDLIIKEKETKVYAISVIIEDSNDDNYINFRKGMDQAAIEMNADVNFITLYESGSQKQQMELILREQQDGAAALVVSPVDRQALADALIENRITVPLVVMNAEIHGNQVASLVFADYYNMGQTVAGQVRRHSDGDLVYLFAPEKMDEASRAFQEGIRSVLEPEGVEIQVYRSREEYPFRKVIEELVYPNEKYVSIIALDQKCLTETAGVLADSNVYFSHVDGLYGRGTAVSTLNYLDKGIIRGVCVTDDYSAGYLSVKKAMDLITGKVDPEPVCLEGYYIEKENLRSGEFEKMLYPVE